MARPPRKPKEESGFFESYAHFSRTLRAWLVAYGVGVPVLLVSQEFIARAIIQAGTGAWITWLFLTGVAIQVLAALLYKYSMAYLYFDETNSIPDDAWQVRLSAGLSRAIWLEVLFDVASITLLVCGTFLAVAAVLAPI